MIRLRFLCALSVPGSELVRLAWQGEGGGRGGGREEGRGSTAGGEQGRRALFRSWTLSHDGLINGSSKFGGKSGAPLGQMRLLGETANLRFLPAKGAMTSSESELASLARQGGEGGGCGGGQAGGESGGRQDRGVRFRLWRLSCTCLLSARRSARMVGPSRLGSIRETTEIFGKPTDARWAAV